MGFELEVGDAVLAAVLAFPAGARGVVVIAQATGGGHASFRSATLRLADVLIEARFATLVLDLLGVEVERVIAADAVDVRVSGDRLVGAIDWLALDAVVGDLPPTLRRLPLGCYARGVAAAGAMIAAGRRPDRVRAIVARNGRPDLAADALGEVSAATLLLVDGTQHDLVSANRRAVEALPGEARLEIAPAGDGPRPPAGWAAASARDWLERHLPGASEGRARP